MVPERLRSRLSQLPPDDATIAYRVTTAGAVVVSVIAAVMQQAVPLSAGLPAIILVPAGFVFSYFRRGKRNVLLKVALAAGLFIAFAAFLSGVRGATSIDDTRTPLVALFLWVQVLHSLDVPRARDLTFSVAASVVLVALAGSLAFSTSFLVFVVLHAAFFLAALVFGYEANLLSVDGEVGREVTEPSPAQRGATRRSLVRRVAALGVATLVCTAAVFVFLPRLPAAQVATLPFSIPGTAQLPGFEGDVSLPDGGGGDDEISPGEFDPDTYFGYGEGLDLHVRGRLSRALVMRVRAPRPSLYRGQVYDVYRDGKWTTSDDELDELRSGGLGSIDMPRSEFEGYGTGDELTQTFYVERELPNIVFHAHRAQELFISETRVRVDDFASVRLPFLLEKDTIYSVISQLPQTDPEALRLSPPVDQTHPAMQRYRALPETLRGPFSELARRITDPHPFAADKAIAVERWLRENKKYRLDISRDPPNRDPVDHFVFEREEGFCEQIASTMALMLRASGVPARIVTGFGPGERNLFTGYWEVRNSDAHAWVEVLYPGFGWVPYDPTFGVPLSSNANTTFMIEPVSRAIGGGVSTAFRALTRGASALAEAMPGPRWAGGLAIVALLGAVSMYGWRRIRDRRRASRGPPDATIDAWLSLERALRAKGWSRASHETPLEFADRLSPLNVQIGANVRELAEDFSALRYGTDAEDERVGRWRERVDVAVRALARR